MKHEFKRDLQNQMTVAELIEVLQKIEDKTQKIEIAVYQYGGGSGYPVAYVPIDKNSQGISKTFLNQVTGVVRIDAYLPSDESHWMGTVIRSL